MLVLIKSQLPSKRIATTWLEITQLLIFTHILLFVMILKLRAWPHSPFKP